MLDPWKKNYDKPRQHIKKQRHHFAVKGTQSQSYGFSSIHRGCESWTIKKTESWRIDGFKLWYWGRLLSPVDCQETKLVNTKRNQPWIFIGRTGAEAEAPILWLPDVKSRLIGKDPDAGKVWGQEKRATEDEMVGWRHWLNGHESEQVPGVGDGQGSLVCCSPWGLKESDTTEQLNNNNNNKWTKRAG